MPYSHHLITTAAQDRIVSMHPKDIGFQNTMAYRSVQGRPTTLVAALGLAAALLVGGGDAFVPDTATTIFRFREQTSRSFESTRSGISPSGLFPVMKPRRSDRLVGRRYRGCDSCGGRGTSGITLSRRAATTATCLFAPGVAAAVESVGSAVGTAASSAAPVLSSLGVLAAVIAFHEAGHLAAALSQGIKVKAFSIGFGPRLLSYRQGGVAEEGGGDEGRGGREGVRLLSGKISGPSWDWGTAGEERGRESRRLRGGDEGKGVAGGGGGGGKKGGIIKRGETGVVREEKGVPDEGVEYTLRAIPVGGFVSFPNNYEVDEEEVVTEFDDPDLLSNRGPGSRAVVVAAGVVANLLLAWGCIFGSVSTMGIVQPNFSPGIVLQEITDPKGGAAAAGFRPKDVLLSINGDPLKIGDNTNLEKAVKTIRASEGRPVVVEVSRDGGDPVMRMVKTALNSNGKYSIGVRLSPNLDTVSRRKAANPAEAAAIAFEETAGMAGKSLDAFVRLASTGDTEGVSGPVEIVKIGAEVATEDGTAALLQFAAVISINLAVINSLPVPGLDGGQMVFVLAEVISRRKLERGVTETINGVALLFLLALSLSTFAGDLGVGELLQRVFTGAVR